MRIWPSAVSRSRSHVAQNGSDTGLMKPTSPMPSANRYTREVELGSTCTGTSGFQPSIISKISRPASTCSRRQLPSASSGMNSMKRTTYPFRRESSANGITSSSVNPRMATAFTLIGRIDGCRSSSSSPASTFSRQSRRVIRWNFSRTSESSDTLMRVKPASASSPAISFNRNPLVVRLTLSSPSPSSGRNIRISFGRSARTVGSPPVSRMFLIPICTKSPASRAISS